MNKNKNRKPIELDFKKAYTELMKVNQNLGKTIRRLESEVKFKDILLDECEKKNETKIMGLEHALAYHESERCDLMRERDFHKRIINKLIQ